MPKITAQTYNSSYKPTWCPGCGDFGIWAAIKAALAELKIQPKDVVIVYGIGCAGNMASTIKCYAFHSLHGRTLPVALGVKMANRDLTVIAVAGDGDQYGEGTNHLIHTARYNLDMTLIVADNQTFSLTTGQASPTSEIGFVSKTTPFGEIKKPLNPIALSIAAGATFVARSAAFEMKHLTEMIKKAILHKGFSHVDVLQQCVTFNKVNTLDWYRKRTYMLEKEGYGHKEALAKAMEKDKLPIGIFYTEDRKTYVDELDLTKDIKAKDQKVGFKKEILKEFK